MPFHTSYGFDPSLQHGSLVQVFTESPPDQIRRITETFSWRKGSDVSLSEHSSDTQVYALAQAIVRQIRPGSARLMAIDYDPRSVYWTRRPMQVALLNLFLGYFIRGIHERGIPVVLLSPDLVRKFFKLKNKQPKGDVHAAFRSQVPLPHHANVILQREDALDATILAYIASKSSLENLDVSHTAQAYLLSGRTPPSDADQAIGETDPPGRPHR